MHERKRTGDLAGCEQRGRQARAEQHGLGDNPFYSATSLTAYQSRYVEWRAKADAWDRGWRAENVRRLTS